MTHCHILCLQEHWLSNFESKKIEELVTDCKALVRCCYDENPTPLYHYRRSQAGVAIVWKKEIDHLVEPLDQEGCDRVVVINIKTSTTSIILISSYLPAGSSCEDIASYNNILDHADVIYELTQRYSTDHVVIWAGDLNGSLERQRYKRDRLLRDFCTEVGYQPVDDEVDPTYHHTAMKSTSRIDHILYLKSQQRIMTKPMSIFDNPLRHPHMMLFSELYSWMLSHADKRQQPPYYQRLKSVRRYGGTSWIGRNI